MSEHNPESGTDCLFVLTTFPSAEVARQIGTELVQKQLAACVNISRSGVESIYTWKGKTESEEEIPAFIKTTRERFPALRDRLAELHPYEVPEIIALPIVDGLPAYLDWVRGKE